MNFDQTNEFAKDLKKLEKRWKSLRSDLSDLELQINRLYLAQEGVDLVEYRKNFFNGKRATILRTFDDSREVVKMRLDVASLDMGSKVRIVFIAVRNKNTVTFIELFSKSDKPREDSARLKKYL